MSHHAFEREIGRINDVLCALNLLTWDARTVMPAGGVDARAEQAATLTSLAHEMATGPALARALEGARKELEGADPGDLRRRGVDLAERELATLRRMPPRIAAEMAALRTRAHAVWAAARAANDFAAFAPALERMMAMQRRIAAAIGDGGHPYDAMVRRHDLGMTHARLQEIFGALKGALVPLIRRAAEAPQPRDDFLTRRFPVPAQKAFAMGIARRMGYDAGRGRLDDAAHPFAISFTRDDVRITGRFREDWLPGGLFAVWHEAGHGMYEQNVAPAFSRTIFATDLVTLTATGGAGLGLHEAQSRLWENRVGRSARFWELHFPELRERFPEQLADVTHRDLWRALNRVRPDCIRVEADELTYDFHIILRSEIEARLMAGEIAVADLPAVWSEKMRDLLGVAVPDDASGVLQDVHWSHGYMGSFPAYTVGNIAASQLFAAAQRAPDVAAGLDRGDYAPLFAFLRDAVWSFGRSSSRDETLARVAGGPLDIAPYVADLTAKVDALTDAGG